MQTLVLALMPVAVYIVSYAANFADQRAGFNTPERKSQLSAAQLELLVHRLPLERWMCSSRMFRSALRTAHAPQTPEGFIPGAG